MASSQARTPAAPLSRPQHARIAFRVGLALSVLLHLLLFLFVRFDGTVERRPARVPLRSYRIAPVMQAYDIEPVAIPPGAPELPMPRRETPLTQITPPPLPFSPVLTLPIPTPEPLPLLPSAAERLSRGYADPTLLQPVGELPPPVLTEADILRMRLEALLGMVNDSLAAAAAAASRATDWTVRGKNGERWGISPGQIHLGKITLPLPFAFSAPPGRREEVAARVRSWYESQSQASRIEAEETFEERVRAIRERQKAQRDSTRRGGG